MESAGSPHREDHFHGAESATSTPGLAHRIRVEPPKFWLKGDLSQIEMVLIAIVTADRNLIKLLSSGRDVYVEYGAAFFEMFPQIAAYHARATEDALSLGRVCTIGGTRRWLPPLVEDGDGDYWPSFERRKKILISTPIQGSGADLVIWAVNRFRHQLEGVEIVNLVHDEVDAIVTRETLKATVDVITRAFEETFAGFYPSSELVPKIKFSCGASWGETVPIDGTGA
jgi:DNA polymerase I-like protein with 3'-5' exonuclease and polymerase domains